MLEQLRLWGIELLKTAKSVDEGAHVMQGVARTVAAGSGPLVEARTQLEGGAVRRRGELNTLQPICDANA